MKQMFTVILGCSLVFTLSAAALAQGKSGGHAPGGPPQTPHIEHGNNAEHGGAHARTEPRNDQKTTNFESRIERNPALKSKLETMLPRNTTMASAANGFRNEGQFIAALHVSKNLNIPFDQLKMKMTGSNAMPLGQAIRALKPDVTQKDADAEAAKAEKEAKADQKTKNTKPVT
jgi:hypothetical protein